MVSHRLSVAMCTCNGERWLPEQLSSIAAQIRLPDELVVCDDASDDGTMTLLREFASKVPFPMRIYANASRLGVVGNFEKAIGLCTGQLIALADQDDVWLPTKVAEGEAALSGGADLAFSDAQVVDESLSPLGYTLWRSAEFGAANQRRMRAGHALPVLLHHQVVTGATAMFRSTVLPLVSPFDRGWVHDGWLAILVAATGRIELVATPLMLYRQHAANAIGGRRRGWLELLGRARKPGVGEGFGAAVARFTAVRNRLIERGLAPDAPAIRQIDDVIGHLVVRTSLGRERWRRLVPVVRESLSGRYQRYSRGFESIAQDLIL